MKAELAIAWPAAVVGTQLQLEAEPRDGRGVGDGGDLVAVAGGGVFQLAHAAAVYVLWAEAHLVDKLGLGCRV